MSADVLRLREAVFSPTKDAGRAKAQFTSTWRLEMSWPMSMKLSFLVIACGAAGVGAQTPNNQVPAQKPITLWVPVEDPKAPPATTKTVVFDASATLAAPAAPATPAPEPAADDGPKFGPTAPEDVKILQSFIDPYVCNSLKAYGWLDVGYTYASSGPGLLPVQPRENRFGNEILFNQAAIVLEKPLDPKCFSWGFNMTFYGGADASLLQPKGGIDYPPDNPRFSADFRQLYVSAHLPVLTEGGLDVKAGRMGTIIGYESALAPYRPFYSNDYQWFYSQDGAWTGVLTNLHVTPQLDVLNGVTMGANTFFTLRSHDSICYIGQVNYWLQEDKRTQLTVSLHLGEDAIFAAPGLAGEFDTVLELRVQHNWSKYLTQIIESNMGWDSNVSGIGTGEWYGVYTILINHLTETLDANLRLDWFDDVQGTRTGVATNYYEMTIGADIHPRPWLSLRPEVRGDFAGAPIWHGGRDKDLFTLAMDVLLKF
jgi:hypothetical protein